MESEPTKNHPTLEAHGGAVLKSEAATSLGCGGWEEGEGFMDTVVELRQENRLGEDDPIVDGSFTSSRHLIIRGSVTRLPEMYSKFKQGEEVTVHGSKVLSLSPAFLVDTSELLPIHYLKIVEDVSKVPGRVVREFKGATILHPVHGYGRNKKIGFLLMTTTTTTTIHGKYGNQLCAFRHRKPASATIFWKRDFFNWTKRKTAATRRVKLPMARHQLVRKSD